MSLPYSKEAQLKKNRKQNEKKLPPVELKAFTDFIFSISKGKCQVCKTAKIGEYHHGVYGSNGADKDDRTLVGICRKCHHAIHHARNNNSQLLRRNAERIGRNNWTKYLLNQKKPNKHGAKKTTLTFHGEEYTFDSKAEADHFVKLTQRLLNKEIERLKLQPKFELLDGFTVATDKTQSGKSKVTGLKYTPDFEYYENGKKIVVEVKGQKTEAYVMRFKLFLVLAYARYGVDTFIEVTNGKETRYECKSLILQNGARV